MSVLGIVFWLWLTVSVVILIRRRVKNRTEATGAELLSQADGHVVSEPLTVEPGSTRSSDAEQTPVEDQLEVASIEDEGPDSPVVDRTDAATSPTPVAAFATGSSGRSVDIADALSGIQMPCDLAPLTVGAAGLDPLRVDLVTTGVGAGEVAARLVSELTRLGYEVADLGAGEHLATRGETVVRVKVHDRPAVSVASDGRGFATAPPDSIVVELALA